VSLTVLSVAYPLAPVGPDSIGGAEQIVHALDRALVEAGHSSIVVAQEGSTVSGILVPVPKRDGTLNPAAREASWQSHGAAIASALARWPVDLIHMHGIDFNNYLPPPGPPVLATLHLPPSWYPREALFPSRPDTWLNCVSHSQQRACPAGMPLIAPIDNGVPVHALQARHARRRFALVLGRVCPEKGIHLAIDAARMAQTPILISGEVYSYPEHERYFAEEIAPRLGPNVRFVGPVRFARKRRLLTAARCVLIPRWLMKPHRWWRARRPLAARRWSPSRAAPCPKPSSTAGPAFVVQTAGEMATAIGRVGEISPELCRAVARKGFSLERMVAGYFQAYEQLASAGRSGRRCATA
jgi:glycosyltransferase involved in cell wall biosynthesis